MSFGVVRVREAPRCIIIIIFFFFNKFLDLEKSLSCSPETLRGILGEGGEG